MSILNVDKIQPIGGGSTITVDATDIQASTSTITASKFVGSVSVTGISTFNDDSTFYGGTSGRNLFWDKSENALEFGDYTYAKFGVDEDLTIWSNNNASAINNKTGELRILSGTNVRILKRNDVGLGFGGELANFNVDGSVELFNAGSKKIETTNTGAVVTGILTATSVDVTTGYLTISNDIKSSDDDFYLYSYKGGSDGQVRSGIQFDSTNQRLEFFTATSERLRIDSSGRLLLGLTSDSRTTSMIISGNTSGATSFGMLNLDIGTTSVSADTNLGIIRFGATGDRRGADIRGMGEGTWNAGSSHPTRLAFYTCASSSTSPTERLRINSSGIIQIGNTENPTNYNVKDIMLGNHSGNHGITILSGTGNGGYIMFSDNNGGGSNAYRGQIEYQHNGDYMRFLTATLERLRITSGGDVGIGDDAPSSRLVVRDVAEHTAYANATPNRSDSIVTVYNNPPNETANDHATIQFGVNGGSHNRVASMSAVAESAGNRKMAFTFCTDEAGSRTEKMRISGDGKLLVGTTTEGSSGVDNLILYRNGNGGITIRNNSNQNGNIFFSRGTSGTNEYKGYIQYQHAQDRMVFGTSNTERLRLTSGGQLIQYTTHTSGSSAHQNTSWYGDDASQYNIEIRDFNEMYATKTVNTNNYNSIIYKREKMTHNCDIEFMLAGGSDQAGSGYYHLGMPICGDGSDTSSNWDRFVFRCHGGTAGNNQIRVDKGGGGSGFSYVSSYIPQFFDGTERHIQIKIRGRRYSVYSDGVEVVTRYSDADNPRTHGFFGFIIYEASSVNPWIKIRDFKLKNHSLNTGVPSYDVIKSVPAYSNNASNYTVTGLNNPRTVEIRFFRMRHSGGDGRMFLRVGPSSGYITSGYNDLGTYQLHSASNPTITRGHNQGQWYPIHYDFNHNTNYYSGCITIRRISNSGQNTRLIYNYTGTVDYDSGNNQYFVNCTGQMTFANNHAWDRLTFYNDTGQTINYGDVEIIAQH